MWLGQLVNIILNCKLIKAMPTEVLLCLLLLQQRFVEVDAKNKKLET